MLRHASLPDLDNSRNRFVPIGELKSLLNLQKIRDQLRIFLDPKSHIDEDVDRMAECISPPTDNCSRCENDSCTGMRILFVALVAIEREQLVTQFCTSSSTCDTTWSLHDTTNSLAELAAKEKEIFTQVQWAMRSPIFKNISSDGKPKVYADEVSMPWAMLKKDKKASKGQGSFVHKLKIHESHHQLASPNACFALKVLQRRKVPSYGRKLFNNEVKANQKVSHPHITPLLGAFTHRSDFYLVLPWASGGNLREFWETHTLSEDLSLWMVEQCYFIADALTTIHGGGSVDRSQGLARQLHADIKPENILCFKEGATSCSLKITDFDRSIPYDPETGLEEKVDQPKTYRPPDNDGPVGLEWDIWSLGCLYIEFVTWALLGYSGVLNFGEARLKEVDAQDPDSPYNPVEEDIFFSRQWTPPRGRRLRKIPAKKVMKIKRAVTSVSRTGRSRRNLLLR
ncbi:Death-associated protein kinase 3 [Colletotrichum sidae]|uniref:Death-associated protein kinase 3 n=1 Tax=Colletotrichum sidae TaxID=1347389 RepID=A0A4R8TT55_9PEZI|nr:Death-associated protein kinase 3 [Colletotrichum sidae]